MSSCLDPIHEIADRKAIPGWSPALSLLVLTRHSMANEQKTPARQGDLATVPRLKKAPRFMVVFHNDDYTTKDFVVHVLMKFFKLSVTEATHIMLSVHHKGFGVAGVFTRDIAETKALQVCEYAKKHMMPLKVTAEPE
jgi:ATP-dependent Clp protease adaptor protein ClpS